MKSTCLAVLAWMILAPVGLASCDAVAAAQSSEKNREPLQILGGYSDPVVALAFSPDSQVLATASADCTLKLWDTQKWRVTHELRHPLQVTCVAFSPDGRLVASGSGLSKPIHQVVSKGVILGNTLVSGVWIYDVATGKEQQVLEGSEGITTAVAFSPDGKMLGIGCSSGIIELWDLASWTRTQTLRGSRQAITSLAFSTDSRQLASVDISTIILWNPLTGKADRILRGHTSQILCVTFAPQADSLASAGSDNQIKLWNRLTGKEEASLKTQHLCISQLAFSPDGKTLAAACSNPGSVLELWELATLRHTHSLPKVGSVAAYSPDGKFLATDGPNATVQVLRVPAL